MNFETIYNRHIRKARQAAKGTLGWDRAIAISDYFDKAGHPHATFTLNQMAGDRVHTQDNDRSFAARLIQDMAYLVATNEENAIQDD